RSPRGSSRERRLSGAAPRASSPGRAPRGGTPRARGAYLPRLRARGRAGPRERGLRAPACRQCLTTRLRVARPGAAAEARDPLARASATLDPLPLRLVVVDEHLIPELVYGHFSGGNALIFAEFKNST